MNRHVIRWTTPAPLWPGLLGPGGGVAALPALGGPTLLRFTTDNFMQDYLDVLATDPRKLASFQVVRETWRGVKPQPTVTRPVPAFALPWQRAGATRRRSLGETPPVPPPDLSPLKLYQPAHERHYLVSACLVCQTPGLPDRRVDAGRKESTSFVVRRLWRGTTSTDDPATWDEYAWIVTPEGSWWQGVGREVDGRVSRKVLAQEERLPLFPAVCQEDDGRPRRLCSGVLPTGKREAYLGAPKRLATDTRTGSPHVTTPKTARKILLRQTVIEPWKALRAQMAAWQGSLNEDIGEGPVPAGANRYKAAREQAQIVSWLLLLDLAEFFQQQIPALWPGIVSGTRPGAGPLRDVYDALTGATLGDTLWTQLIAGISPAPVRPANLREALARYGAAGGQLNEALRTQLESVDQPYDRGSATKRAAWPGFLFPLADPEHSAPFPNVTPVPPLSVDEQADLATSPAEELDEFAALIVRAMPETAAGPEPAIPTAALPPTDAADQFTGFFRVRCVYARPSCGPVHDDVISDPSEPFEIAGYFDPDAPARPIRIGLPVDTTPAGLRKFNKNTAFVLSDILCGQVNRMKGITFGDLIRSVLPWPLHKDLSVGDMTPCAKPAGGVGFGTICSLSIPIITLCALILLIIMVTLLDFIFRWLPFFFLCFPVPGLKGKK